MRPVLGSHVVQVNEEIPPSRRGIEIKVELLRRIVARSVPIRSRPPNVDIRKNWQSPKIALGDCQERGVGHNPLDAWSVDAVFLDESVDLRYWATEIEQLSMFGLSAPAFDRGWRRLGELLDLLAIVGRYPLGK